jgi:hypothetical protein
MIRREKNNTKHTQSMWPSLNAYDVFDLVRDMCVHTQRRARSTHSTHSPRGNANAPKTRPRVSTHAGAAARRARGAHRRGATPQHRRRRRRRRRRRCTRRCTRRVARANRVYADDKGVLARDDDWPLPARAARRGTRRRRDEARHCADARLARQRGRRESPDQRREGRGRRVSSVATLTPVLRRSASPQRSRTRRCASSCRRVSRRLSIDTRVCRAARGSAPRRSESTPLMTTTTSTLTSLVRSRAQFVRTESGLPAIGRLRTCSHSC